MDYKEKREAILLENEIKLKELEEEFLTGEELQEAESLRKLRNAFNTCLEAKKYNINFQWEDVSKLNQVHASEGFSIIEIIGIQTGALQKNVLKNEDITNKGLSYSF